MIMLLFLLLGELFPQKILWALSWEEMIPSPALNKAKQELLAGRAEEALALIQEARVPPQEVSFRHLLLGRAYEALHQPSTALIHYRTAYFHAPNEMIKALAYLERAETYYRMKNYDEAAIVYRLFLKNFSFPELMPRAHLGLARCLGRQGFSEEALAHFEKAGNEASALLGKAVVLHKWGRYSEAAEYFQKGMALDGDLFARTEEFLFYYGANLLELGQIKEAVPFLTSKLSDPFLKNLGDLYLGRAALKDRKFDQAERLSLSALTASEHRIRREALLLLAQTFLAAGKKEAARQAFFEFWSKYPMVKGYDGVLLALAELDLNAGKTEGASRFIRELGFYPRLPEDTLNTLQGLILKLKDKDPQRVAGVWQGVGRHFLLTAKEPFLLVMVEVLKDAGRLQSDLLKWLAQNGSEAVRRQSKVALVRLKIDQGQWKEAEEDLRSLAASKIPKDEILRLQARLHQAQGDYVKAGRAILAVKKMETADLALLQESLQNGVEEEAVLRVLEKNAARLGGNATVFLRLADAYWIKGKRKEALQYYQKVLEFDPLNKWALLRVGNSTEGEEGKKMLAKLKEENSWEGRLAAAYLKEREIRSLMEGGR